MCHIDNQNSNLNTRIRRNAFVVRRSVPINNFSVENFQIEFDVLVCDSFSIISSNIDERSVINEGWCSVTPVITVLQACLLHSIRCYSILCLLDEWSGTNVLLRLVYLFWFLHSLVLNGKLWRCLINSYSICTHDFYIVLYLKYNVFIYQTQ